MSEIDAELLSALFARYVPAPIMAAGLAQGCGRLSREHPEMAVRVLKNMWIQISPLLESAIAKNPAGQLATAAVLLESYFLFSGEWEKMEKHLVQHTPVNPLLAQRVMEEISLALVMKAREQRLSEDDVKTTK